MGFCRGYKARGRWLPAFNCSLEGEPIAGNDELTVNDDEDGRLRGYTCHTTHCGNRIKSLMFFVSATFFLWCGSWCWCPSHQRLVYGFYFRPSRRTCSPSLVSSISVLSLPDGSPPSSGSVCQSMSHSMFFEHTKKFDLNTYYTHMQHWIYVAP